MLTLVSPLSICGYRFQTAAGSDLQDPLGLQAARDWPRDDSQMRPWRPASPQTQTWRSQEEDLLCTKKYSEHAFLEK